MRRTAAALLLLALAGGLCGAAPLRKSARPGLHVDGETAVLVTKLPFDLHCGDAADLYQWSLPPGWEFKENEDGNVLTVTKAPEGQATVTLRTLVFNPEGKTPAEKKVRRNYTLAVVVGKAAPAPKPPDPPGPNPPGPTPTPDAGPIKVLMVYESADTLPAAQQSVLTGRQVREYLRARGAPDPAAGDGKAYRIWDKDVDTAAVPQFWKDAVARFRATKGASTPWVIIYREGAAPAYEGPLPATVPDALALLKRFGG